MEFYDLPQVANYSVFYRLPLGSPASLADLIASKPGTFGYDEATRKFNLPPASGLPELNFFASRSTIDTGVTTSGGKTLFATSVTNADQTIVTISTFVTDKSQQDLTINNDLRFCLTIPLPASGDFHSALSGGLDFKTYEVDSAATNNYYLSVLETLYNNSTPPPTVPITSSSFIPVPYTVKNHGVSPAGAALRWRLAGCLGLANFDSV